MRTAALPADLRADTLQALLTTASALASGIHLEGVLQTIAEQAARVLGAERSSVYLYDPEGDELYGVVTLGAQPHAFRFPADAGLAGEAARTRTVLNVPDAPLDARFDPHFDTVSGFRTRSVLCAPLVDSERGLVGVLQALNKRDAPAFTREDEALIEAFGTHACLAIERAHLVENYARQERLEASLRVARDVQMAWLPRDVPPSGAAYDLAAHLRPAHAVGGDFYDVFHLDANRLAFAVGDAAGKGVPAALVTHGTSAMLRLAATEGLPPERCFEAIHRVQKNRQALFVTLFYGVLDLRTGEVVYANAGHPPPLLLRGDGSAAFSARAENLPIGLLRSAHFRTERLRLAPGESLVLYTDGMLEARDAAGREFGAAGLREAAVRTAAGTAQEVVAALLSHVDAFTAGAPQHDDLTVLTLRYAGPRRGRP